MLLKPSVVFGGTSTSIDTVEFQAVTPFDSNNLMTVQENAFPAFPARMLHIIKENNVAIMMMKDGICFNFNGTLSKQNCHYWATENIWSLHQRPLHSPKL